MTTIHHGNCVTVMADMPEASVDAIVCDPPYELGFMGKSWDSTGVAYDPDTWRAARRVLKPGGHLLAFGGTRTWHRLAVAVEDAGFEIRDSIAWMYGSGFPKSHDVSKAIDKLDAADERRARNLSFTAWMRSTGITAARINEVTGTNMGNHYLTDKEQPSVATADLFDMLRPHLPPVPADIEELVRLRTVESQNFKARAVLRVETRTNEPSGIVNVGQGARVTFERKVTDAHTDGARQWNGWGTALKPAHEPIVVARKPLAGTVAQNVLTQGTGALNVDACRIETDDNLNGGAYAKVGGRSESASLHGGSGMNVPGKTVGKDYEQPAGRWPANVILDEGQAAALDAQSGASISRKGKPRSSAKPGAGWGMTSTGGEYDDQGGASRFFYVAKAPKNERPVANGVAHPTVKPLTLMRWLVRLVTPLGGTVLDPFAGSGTTIEAAIIEGFTAVGIEQDANYLPLIQERIRRQEEADQELDFGT